MEGINERRNTAKKSVRKVKKGQISRKFQNKYSSSIKFDPKSSERSENLVKLKTKVKQKSNQ